MNLTPDPGISPLWYASAIKNAADFAARCPQRGAIKIALHVRTISPRSGSVVMRGGLLTRTGT
jgi:hypothetical protein